MISVIIPTLNEAELLPVTLAAVRQTRELIEVLVVDGGSTDATFELARASGARELLAPHRGRSAQLNHGAAMARGNVLLFLHADTALPVAWAEAIQRALLEDVTRVGGAFRRRYVPGSAFLRVTCALAGWRGRWTGWFLGDQAIFVRRGDFDAVGGFAAVPACEDLDLCLRLARRGRMVLLRETVRTSDRRFQRRGVVRQSCLDVATVWRFLRGQRDR